MNTPEVLLMVEPTFVRNLQEAESCADHGHHLHVAPSHPFHPADEPVGEGAELALVVSAGDDVADLAAEGRDSRGLLGGLDGLLLVGLGGLDRRALPFARGEGRGGVVTLLAIGIGEQRRLRPPPPRRMFRFAAA